MKNIQQLKEEIEKRYKEVRKSYEEYGKKNNWEEKNIHARTMDELEENDTQYGLLKAQLKARKEALEDELRFLNNLKFSEDYDKCDFCDVNNDFVEGRINKIKEELGNA